MSYALVPYERYHPVLRLRRGERLVRPRWAAAGLGDLPAGLPTADTFWFDPDGWFYLYTWTPSAGWNVGAWVRGLDLCRAVAPAPASAWHVIFDVRNRLVLVDRDAATEHAACFQFASFAPPGATIAV